MKRLLATALENRLELIGGLAAIFVCLGLVWGAAHEQRYADAGQVYVIENGKWLPVYSANPTRSD